MDESIWTKEITPPDMDKVKPLKFLPAVKMDELTATCQYDPSLTDTPVVIHFPAMRGSDNDHPDGCQIGTTLGRLLELGITITPVEKGK
jgi:hypothetical protein